MQLSLQQTRHYYWCTKSCGYWGLTLCLPFVQAQSAEKCAAQLKLARAAAADAKAAADAAARAAADASKAVKDAQPGSDLTVCAAAQAAATAAADRASQSGAYFWPAMLRGSCHMRPCCCSMMVRLVFSSCVDSIVGSITDVSAVQMGCISVLSLIILAFLCTVDGMAHAVRIELNMHMQGLRDWRIVTTERVWHGVCRCSSQQCSR